MVTIQRVRVRWSAAGRGAAQAETRRGLCRPARLPSSLPGGAVVVHDLLADEASGYAWYEDVRALDFERVRDIGLELTPDGDGIVVGRLPGWGSPPHHGGSRRLFRLRSGQVGEYLANFRFAGGCCASTWHYEEWLVRVGNELADAEQFPRQRPVHQADHRLHLYGGPARTR